MLSSFNLFLLGCVILSVIIIATILAICLKPQTESFLPFYTCYMKMMDIDPQFIDNYKSLDGKVVKCGPCQDSTLKVQIQPCPTDDKGVPNSACNPSIMIGSSDGRNIAFNKYITPDNISGFFCVG